MQTNNSLTKRDWMFDKETGERNHLGQWSNDKSLLENKDWDKVAICTWLL